MTINTYKILLGILLGVTLFESIEYKIAKDKLETVKLLKSQQELAIELFDKSFAEANTEVLLEDIKSHFGHSYRIKDEYADLFHSAMSNKVYNLLFFSSKITLKSPARILLYLMTDPQATNAITIYDDRDIKELRDFVDYLKSKKDIQKYLEDLDRKSLFYYLDHDNNPFSEKIRLLREMQNKLKDEGYLIARKKSIEGTLRQKQSAKEHTKQVLNRQQRHYK